MLYHAVKKLWVNESEMMYAEMPLSKRNLIENDGRKKVIFSDGTLNREEKMNNCEEKGQEFNRSDIAYRSRH